MADQQGAEPDRDETHIEETMRSVLRFRTEHLERATLSQRLIAQAAERLGRPRTPLILAAALAIWMGGNLVAARFGFAALDPAPFIGLQCALDIASFFALVLVLAAQTHEDQHNKQRDLLQLELALLAERKTAKVIELLEELRRDLPLVHDRHDPTAHGMSSPMDTSVVLDSIRQELSAQTASVPR